MEKQIYANPWKGLQSYQENDAIFGRDDEIKNLYNRILFDIQTVVYGKSGIGKSSIINAGIVPRAKLDGMLPVDIRLAHTVKKDQNPTIPYTEQIKNRIAEVLGVVGGEAEDVSTSLRIDSLADEHPKSLWELLHRYRFWKVEDGIRKRVLPLLLFDQFEEIFTLELDRKRVDAFFSELADLLNEVKPDYLFPSAAMNDIPSASEPEFKETGSNTKPRNVFSEIANRRRVSTTEFLEKSEFHVVITLREDFLSDLERHTTYIPGMKSNRFAILPLNEEQAAKIIMEPIKGLIDKPVAKEIIQRLTGCSDFKLDGIPEIEVNASLLSLYMEQLYNKKLQSNAETISLEMVKQYGNYFIANFYEESIMGIPADVIRILEEELITNADKRDNIAKVDLIAKGVDEKYINLLLNKKVLQKFHYNDDERIELIHDTLCPVVNDRILHRQQIKEEEERRQKEWRQLKKLKRSRRITAGVSVVACLALAALTYAVYKYLTKPTTIIEDKYVDVMLVFNPDETLEGDFWEADVDVSLLKDSINIMTLLSTNKQINGQLHVKGPGADTIMVRMLMNSIEVPFKMKLISHKEWLCENKEEPVKLEKPNVDSLRTVTWTMTLTRDKSAVYQFCGHVTTPYGTPIRDAIVVFGDKLTRTDVKGDFTYRLKDSTELMGCALNVFKSEYIPMEIRGVDILKRMKNNNEFNISINIRPEYDSLYYRELTIVDKIVGKENLTAKDSLYVNMFLGNKKKTGFSKVMSPDTTFYYVFAKDNGKIDKDENEEGRIFGYYLTKYKKNEKVPFDGYMEELERGIMNNRRWKMSISAHDSIFNKERIIGIISNNIIDLNK